MTTHTIKSTSAGANEQIQSSFVTFGQVAALWFARARQRHQLRSLSAEQLFDMGISAEAARREADKPFWRK